MIRKKVSGDDDPPITELANTGVVPFLVALLKPEFYEVEKLVIETSWIVANIASRDAEHVEFLVSLEVMPLAIKLLEHPNMEIKNNALWILSNICGDANEYRKAVLEMGIVPQLEKLFIHKDLTEPIVEVIFWMIFNLCRKPYPEFSEVSLCFFWRFC